MKWIKERSDFYRFDTGITSFRITIHMDVNFKKPFHVCINGNVFENLRYKTLQEAKEKGLNLYVQRLKKVYKNFEKLSKKA